MHGIQTNIQNIKGHLFGAAITLSTAVFAAILFSGSPARAEEPLYKDQAAPVEDRVADLLGRMTLEEKVGMVSGDPATGFNSLRNDRLGIPEFFMADGPHGVRVQMATCFPTGVGLGATWSEETLEKVGVALGREALGKGRNTLLGPCINIHRQPFGGRNFESFAEDPYLTGRLAVGYVKGVQSQGVVATPKHYAVNNQENQRMTISAEISERALREIYLPHFKAAIVEAGAWSIMASYNRINGTYAAENPHLMREILKDDWGFQGFAMSDWDAVHSTVPTAMSGLDLEMPTGRFMGKDLLNAVNDGSVPESQIDEMVRRMLRVMMLSGIFDGKSQGKKEWVNSPESRDAALEAAREGITLLKNNNGALPLDRGKIRSVAILGPNARMARIGGGGSSSVTPVQTIPPLNGIRKIAGDGIEVKYAMGCDLRADVDFNPIAPEYLVPPEGAGAERGLLAEYFKGNQLEGDPVVSIVEEGVDDDWGRRDPVEGLNTDNFSARWTGQLVPPEDGEYELVAVSDGVTRLYLNDKLVVNNWAMGGPGFKSKKLKLRGGKAYKLLFEYRGMGNRSMARLGWRLPGRENAIDEAARLAKESDAAVVFVGLDDSFEGEGNDRENLELPGLQNQLIQKVAAANPRTIVVLNNGTPLILDQWIDKVPTIVEAWYPGQEGGRAIAEILFGDVNPSGKLPVTFPKSWEDSPAYPNYPGADGKVNYAEDIFVGYRWYDEKNIDPVYPFGHGLSYTQFEYSDLKIEPATLTAGGEAKVTLTVKNAGPVAGKEVVQLYVSDPEASVPRPPKELKGIGKILLQPGESKTVSFTIGDDALSFFDLSKRAWTAEPGRFVIEIGSSSRDIRLKGDLELK